MILGVGVMISLTGLTFIFHVLVTGSCETSSNITFLKQCPIDHLTASLA